MTTDIAVSPVVLAASAVAELPSTPLGPQPGVSQQVLWEAGASMAGVLTIDRGCRLGRHSHHTNHHHIWVLSGHAVILGAELGAGSYVHIPSGVEHDIDASATEGCSVDDLSLCHSWASFPTGTDGGDERC